MRNISEKEARELYSIIGHSVYVCLYRISGFMNDLIILSQATQYIELCNISGAYELDEKVADVLKRYGNTEKPLVAEKLKYHNSEYKTKKPKEDYEKFMADVKRIYGVDNIRNLPPTAYAVRFYEKKNEKAKNTNHFHITLDK